MAIQAYYTWDAAGRPHTVARPIREYYALLGQLGVRRLGTIGNEDHLQASRPQDHTPFSVTAWPGPLKGYEVWAADAANETRNGVSLGQSLLWLARNGKAPWIKYLNFAGRQYHCRDNFATWVPNSDQHVHVSGRTDHRDTGLAPDFVLFSKEAGTGVTMEFTEADRNVAWATTNRTDAILNNRESAEFSIPGEPGPRSEPNNLRKQLDRIEGKIDGQNVQITLTDAQIDRLGAALAAGAVAHLLDVLTDVAQGAADTFRDRLNEIVDPQAAEDAEGAEGGR